MQTPPTHRAVHVFEARHPTSEGHFAGNPIIPGACLLREVLAAMDDAHGIHCRGMTSVKFLHPVRPGDAMAIEWRVTAPDTIRFTCLLDGTARKLMTGAVLVASRANMVHPSGATQLAPS
jgi:3-hydroxymyristoyl/3-hydroxydecanoyl-(acyl carrier protein) dehydratase